MVTVNDYAIRTNSDGDTFIALILSGEVEMVQSLETGRYYATIRTCSVSSTFDEATAKSIVGQQIPGQIVKVECDPYEYTVEDTGEQLILNHRYEFRNDAIEQKSPLQHSYEENGILSSI